MERDGIRLSTGFVSGGNDFGRIFLYAVSLYALCIAVWVVSLLNETVGLWLVVVCWLVMLITVGGFFADMLLYSSRRLWLEQDRIRVTCFGLELRRVPLSDVKFVCAVGGERCNFLCLSLESPQTLTQRCETRLRKSFFGKHELIFRQRAGQWPEKAAREQLLHILAKPYLLLAPRSLLFLKMDAAKVAVIRQLYPKLPYYNWMAPDEKLFTNNYKNVIPTWELQFYSCTPEFGADNIRILQGKAKKLVRMLPAERIRTIVRTDSYVKRTKYDPLHKAILLISTQDRQTLAEQGVERIGPEWKQLPNWQDIAVTAHCLWLADGWSVRKTDYLPVFYTPETEALLRELYPQAQWVDCITPIVEKPLCR